MVLPAPPPHDAHGPDAGAWLVRLNRILCLVQKGVLVLVDRAHPARLGDLVRSLLPTHPDLEVHTRASSLARAEKGALLILVPQPEHADWLNQERPVLANRALRVILFSGEATTAHLARRAPDFFHWISHRIECPDGAPRFAVNGLRAALRARARGVAWGGGDLDRCFAAALPGRELIRASASLGYEQMVEVARPRGRGWVAWSDVDSPARLRRVCWASAETGRRARSILVEPAVEVPGFWPVHGRMLGIQEARAALVAAGAKYPGRLAALLDLEPAAVAAAAGLLHAGEEEAAIRETVRAARDPGVAVAKLAGARGGALGATLWARSERVAEDAADEIEALLHEARAGRARWVAAAKASLEKADPKAGLVWAQRGLAAEPASAKASQVMRELTAAIEASERSEESRATTPMRAAPQRSAMTRDRLLDALCALLPAQFDMLAFKLNVPARFLAGSMAPQASRATDLLRWAEQMHRLADVEQGYRQLVEAPVPPTPRGEVRVSIARLPVTSRELFGRDADLQWLDTCWREGVHVASIVAWGGVGKTALVNRWLAGMRDKDWDAAERVYGWSFYSQGTDRLASADEFIDAALRWFGDADPNMGSPWDKGERLASLVRKHKTILVLDGVEPLQWGPGADPGKLKDPALQALVKDLGAQNKGLCLVTSRLEVTDLEALSGNKVRKKRLDHLSEEAGAELLSARGTKGSQEERREAAREYKGHALALTLLGSYLADVADGDIRQRREIGPLEEDERQGEHARRVLAAYEKRLGKPELAILHMIGLFDRPANHDEITALRAEPAVAGLTDALTWTDRQNWKKAVAKLGRAGLLAEDDNKRLDAHPIVREHFGGQLRREYPEAWREGHRRLYEHLKKKAKPLPATIAEMEPLYEAVVHGCLAGKNQEALDVYWHRIQRGEEHFNMSKLSALGSDVTVLSAFFDPPWEQLAPGLREPDQAFVLSNAGFALQTLGRLPEATGLMRLSLDGYVSQEHWKGAASSASNLSAVLQLRGELREAVAVAQESVALGDRSAEPFQRMITRSALTAALHAMGRVEEAAVQAEDTERVHKERQPNHPLLYGLMGFRYCDVLLDLGRETEVLERATSSLEITEGQRWIVDIALDNLSLGRAYLCTALHGSPGDLVQAAIRFDRAVDGLRPTGRQDYLPLGLLARAALRTRTRNFSAARRDLDEAFTIATRSGFRLHEADAHLGYARLALAEGSAATSREHLAKARAIIEETGYHRRDGELAALEAEAAGRIPA